MYIICCKSLGTELSTPGLGEKAPSCFEAFLSLIVSPESGSPPQGSISTLHKLLMGSHWAWCIFANFNGGLGDPCSVKRKVFSHSKVLFFQYLCISLADIYGLAFVHIMMTLEAKRYLHVDRQSEGPRVHSSLFSAVGG